MLIKRCVCSPCRRLHPMRRDSEKELFRKLRRIVKVVNENNTAMEGKTVHYNSLLERRGSTVPGSRAWMTVSLVVSILGAGAVGMMGWLAFLADRLPFLSQGERLPFLVDIRTDGDRCILFSVSGVALRILSARKQRKKAEQLFVSLDGEIQSLKKNLNELKELPRKRRRRSSRDSLAGELEVEVRKGKRTFSRLKPVAGRYPGFERKTRVTLLSGKAR